MAPHTPILTFFIAVFALATAAPSKLAPAQPWHVPLTAVALDEDAAQARHQHLLTHSPVYRSFHTMRNSTHPASTGNATGGTGTGGVPLSGEYTYSVFSYDNSQSLTSILAGMISVGTPPQYVTVEFDFFSNDFYVLDVNSQVVAPATDSDEATAKTAVPDTGSGSSPTAYNSSASSTANTTSQQPFYANYHDVTGTTVQEVVGLGRNFNVNVTIGDAINLTTTDYFYGFSFTYEGYGTVINGSVGMNLQYDISQYMHTSTNVTGLVDQIAKQTSLTDDQK